MQMERLKRSVQEPGQFEFEEGIFLFLSLFFLFRALWRLSPSVKLDRPEAFSSDFLENLKIFRRITNQSSWLFFSLEMDRVYVNDSQVREHFFKLKKENSFEILIKKNRRWGPQLSSFSNWNLICWTYIISPPKNLYLVLGVNSKNLKNLTDTVLILPQKYGDNVNTFDLKNRNSAETKCPSQHNW